MFGIDISKWQGNFDMKRAKEKDGVEFVIIKGGGGDSTNKYVDSKFKTNYANAKSLGLPCGCYWFSRATTEEDAIEEAEYFYKNCLEGRQFELPIVMDVEHKWMLALSNDKLSRVVDAFCNYLEEKKCYVAIYSSAYVFNHQFTSRLDRYDRWVAYWGSKKPNNCDIWQNSSTKKIAGQTTDTDYCYTDYSVIKNKGFNGFSGNPTETKKKTNDEIADEVIAGLWDNGVARKEKLTRAGYDYYVIQKIVNEKLGLTQTIKYYTIKKGDTLTYIARQFHTTVKQLCEWNSIKNPDLIYEGDKIRVQ